MLVEEMFQFIVATDIQKFGAEGITIHPVQMSATFAIKMPEI
jgi:hypothetical protein